MVTLTITFQISDDAFDLLDKIRRDGEAEYRDPEWPTLESFKQSEDFLCGNKTEDWYLRRNCGGTYHLIEELDKYDLVDINTDSWHMTYSITPFGEKAFNSKK